MTTKQEVPSFQENDMDVTVSVIVPVYNAEPYIDKCIHSLLNQTHKNIEILLVDDGSPDNCGNICDDYARRDTRVKTTHKKNGGVSEARNTGLEQAKGDYIYFADPDDWVRPELLHETLHFCLENRVDIVCFDVCEIKNGKQRKQIHHRFDSNRVFTSQDALEKILIDVIDNSPCNKLFKKRVWDNVRFPAGRRFEDVATIYKTFYNADKIGYIRDYYYYYLKHEGSAIAQSFDAQRRYECFLGYKERYEFSKKFCPAAEEKCKMFAVKAALSAVTALEAGSGALQEQDKKELFDFLFSMQGHIAYLNGKNKLLLWGIKNFPAINKIYGKLSFWSKKVK